MLDKSVAICQVHPNKVAANAYLDHSYKLRKSLTSSLAEVSLSGDQETQAIGTKGAPPHSSASSSTAAGRSRGRGHDDKVEGHSPPPAAPKKKMMRRKKKKQTEL